MGVTLEARVKQKTDTLENWLANTLPLLEGELAIVVNGDGAPYNFKVGEPGDDKTFAELPWMIDYTEIGSSMILPTAPGGTLPDPGPCVARFMFVEPGVYYNPGGGSFTAAAETFTILFWDGSTWAPEVEVPIEVDLSEYVTQDEINLLIGKPSIYSYPKDFSPMTNSSGANRFYASNVPLLKPGALHSLRVKTTIVGSTITAAVYTITGTQGALVTTLIHTYDPFVTTAMEHTQTGFDPFVIPAGAFVAFRSNTAIYYQNVAGQNTMDITQNPLSWVGIKVAYDFTIDEAALDPTAVYPTIEALDLRVSSLETRTTNIENTALVSVPLKPAVLYSNKMQSITDFTAVNWVEDSDSEGAIPNSIGSANHLWLKKKYHLEPRQVNLELTLSADSVFWIECAALDIVHNNGAFAIDVAANTVYIYWNANGAGTFTVLASKVLTELTLTAGRHYAVELDCYAPWTNKITVSDMLTGAADSLTYVSPATSYNDEFMQADSYKMYLKTGTLSGVKLWNLSLASKKRPLIWASGDSIAAGFGFPTTQFYQRHLVMLKTALKGNLIISARGSSVLKDVADTVETEMQFILPDYALICIGTNYSGFTNGALTTVVNRIIALGVMPIINRIPVLNSAASNYTNADSVARNAIIDSVCAATGAIRGALFDVATGVGGDPTNQNASLFFGDKIHPNIDGNKAMFDRYAIDLPFLFA